MGHKHNTKAIVRTISTFLLTTILVGMITTTAVAAPLIQRVDAFNYPTYFLSDYDGELYISANGGDGSGRELWVYDSTTDVASLAADINSGANNSNPACLTVYNGKLYFAANAGDGSGMELWSYDSSTGIASLAADIYSGTSSGFSTSIRNMAVYNGKLYFGANGGDGSGNELWSYDSNTGTASLVADIISGSSNSSPNDFAVYDGKLYFQAVVASGGFWLYAYDGTSVSQVTESAGFTANYLTVYNEKLYFNTQASNGYELWVYDSATNTTSEVLDIYNGSSSGNPSFLTVYNDKLYFGANGGDGSGQELWSYDGSTASLVKDLYSGLSSSTPTYLEVYNGKLYFRANGDGSAFRLWVYEDDSISPQISTSTPNNGARIMGTSQLSVTFSEDMQHDGESGAADYSGNYRLLEANGDGFQANGCSSDVGTQDRDISIDSVNYDNNDGDGPFTVEVNVNSGNALPAGSYRFIICGVSSVHDLAGNKINNGADKIIDFTVNGSSGGSGGSGGSSSSGGLWLPGTGFAPGVVTNLPSQPADKYYTDYAELKLDIPALEVEADILGVPQSGDSWDLSWLNREEVGWLEGTAFPTWSGNAVLTGHVTDANGQPGLFRDLSTLKWGDEIVVHAFGQDYVYEVREVDSWVDPQDTSFIADIQDGYPWLTLLTCRGYDEESGTYLGRVAVRAVQIRVE